jgi:predicted lipoprotein with Yx(FWY)xxD motif
VVPEVLTPEPVWLVIHLQNQDGTMGEFIGFTKVPAGVSKNVPVKVDTNRVTPVIYAMLHRDLGINGRLEFPGPDVPVEVNGVMLTPPFNIISEASVASGDVPIGISTAGSGIGHLVDGAGMSLYIFLRDTPGKSNCTGECAQEWRPLLATGAILPRDGIDPVKLGVILLADGNRQVTYSGSPLYYYTKDSNPGEINGHGLGGLWFLVNP